MIRAIFVALVFGCGTLSASAQSLSPDDLARRAIERRAIEAVNWGMPAVNYDLMLQEMLNKTPGKVNQDSLLVASPRLAQSNTYAQP
jgi:hypothetical protein